MRTSEEICKKLLSDEVQQAAKDYAKEKKVFLTGNNEDKVKMMYLFDKVVELQSKIDEMEVDYEQLKERYIKLTSAI